MKFFHLSVRLTNEKPGAFVCPFNKLIRSLYFHSFVVSVLFARFHFKVIRKSLYTIQSAYVVVQFYPWFKFSCLLFLGMVMYDNNMINSLKQRKRKFEPRIKLNHNAYTSTGT